MNKSNRLSIIDDKGKKEYDILYSFYWLKTDKNYVIYTDNTFDDSDCLNVFASIYYPNSKSLESIKTDEEWDLIEKRLNREFNSDGDLYEKY